MLRLLAIALSVFLSPCACVPDQRHGDEQFLILSIVHEVVLCVVIHAVIVPLRLEPLLPQLPQAVHLQACQAEKLHRCDEVHFPLSIIIGIADASGIYPHA